MGHWGAPADLGADSAGEKLIGRVNGQSPGMGFTGEALCVERPPPETSMPGGRTHQ